MKTQKKLFENVNGNCFRLLTESMESPQSNLVRSGIKKVFANAKGNVSYNMVENVGLGYIKDVSEAIKCALQEAREVAKEFGFKDDENSEKFIKTVNEDGGMSAYDVGGFENDQFPMTQSKRKSSSHDETDMSNPEESREVQIAKEIKQAVNIIIGNDENVPGYDLLNKIHVLAQELIKMHGGK